MGTATDPTWLGYIFAWSCFIGMAWIFIQLLRGSKPKQSEKQIEPYREIRERGFSGTEDERAGFVEAKMERIERAMRS